MDDIQLIEKLTCCRGASGFEEEVLLIAREYLDGVADFKEDAMRNLYIYPKYNKGRPTVLLDAHSDEVGFMIQAIKPDGTLRFIPVGGWNERCLPSSKVQVFTKKGYVTGVIAAGSPHLMTEAQRNAPPTYDTLFIDVGATSDKEAAESFGIEIGAPVVPLTPLEYDREHGILHGKAFDDRLGVAALLKCIKNLQNVPLSVDITGVISSQEEVGLRGITAALYNVKADAAICFEGCPADDTFAAPYMVQDAIKGGVMLRYMDRSIICSPRLTALAREVAKERGIKVQMAVRTGGGNNGAEIISANGSTPVIVAGIPVRYIHTFNCIAAIDDFNSLVAFGEELVKALTPAKIAAL